MPVTKFAVPEKYKYQNGFNSYHEYVKFGHNFKIFSDLLIDPKPSLVLSQ